MRGGVDEDEAVASGAPNPNAQLRAMDETQLQALERVGDEWSRVCAEPSAWRDALPVDPNLGSYPVELEPTRFGRFVAVAGRNGELPALRASSELEEPSRSPARLLYQLRRVVLGPPLNASSIAMERMRKLRATPEYGKLAWDALVRAVDRKGFDYRR